MAAPPTYPCDGWADTSDLELCPGCDPDALIDPAIRDNALTAANKILYVLSGRQFPGTCEETVRPCRKGSWDCPGWWDWYAGWGSCGCGASDSSRCGCSNLSQIDLGKYPIVDVGSVWVDGVQLAADDYRVDDYRYLVRLDDEQWPGCQDLTEASHSMPNTFEVTYTWGRDPGEEGRMAAARLACELAKSYSGRACQLPERVQSISRQGVDMVMLDPMEFLENGRTGIYLVDLWLKAVNPSGATMPAAFFTPDSTPYSRKVGT